MPQYTVGDKFWYVDLEDVSDEGCFEGELQSMTDSELTIKTKKDGKDHKVDIKNEESYGKMSDEFPDNGFNDMVELTELNQAELSRNLMVRFRKDLCYCYTGPTLVALNLFKRVKGVFDPDTQKAYMGADKIRASLPPHCYAVANDCVTNLIDNPNNLGGNERCQTVIITGESGAGKSFTTEKILNFVAALGGGDGADSVAAKVLAANPILEAFGNSKMPRNDDSSRFGKLFRLKFDINTRIIIGADICPYLLEKSRIAIQASGERNYHSFYMLLKGLEDAQRKQFFIVDRTEYKFLNRYLGKVPPKLDSIGIHDVEGDKVCYEVWSNDEAGNPTIFRDDQKLWRELLVCFDGCLFDANKKEEIIRILAGTLLIGNVQYIGDEGSMDDAKIKNPELLANVASLIKIDAGDLGKGLVQSTKDPKFGPSPLANKKASKIRDAVGKTFYAEMFIWLIEDINKSVLRIKDSEFFVGVLDIFGFEYIQPAMLQAPKFKNAFEQLCINFCNEKLQNHFVNYIFKLEQETYRSEGIDVGALEFVDNEATLQLIQNAKGGVLGEMDRCCAELSGDETTFDQKFLDCLYKLHDKKHPSFEKPKNSPKWNGFTIKHYAADVIYDVAEFIEKNADSLTLDLYKCIKESGIKGAVGSMFQASFSERYNEDGTKVAVDKKNPVPATVAAKFKQSLDNLITVLLSTTPSFVRCIKPNKPKKPNLFEGSLVLKQLKYSGMLDTLKIRKVGYPDRLKFDEFYERFRPLAPTARDSQSLVTELYKMNPPDTADCIYSSAMKVGKTRMFLRDYQKRFLDVNRKVILGAAAVIVQAAYACRSYRSAFLRQSVATRSLEPIMKGTMDRIQYYKQKRIYLENNSRKKLQLVIRATMARVKYGKMKAIFMETINRHNIQAWVLSQIYRQQYLDAKAEYLEEQNIRTEKAGIAAAELKSLAYVAEVKKELELEANERIVSKLEDAYVDMLIDAVAGEKFGCRKESELSSAEDAMLQAQYSVNKIIVNTLERDRRQAQMDEQWSRIEKDAQLRVREVMIELHLQDKGAVKYQRPGLTPLPSDMNDIDKMKHYLCTAYGTPIVPTEVFKDEEPARPTKSSNPSNPPTAATTSSSSAATPSKPPIRGAIMIAEGPMSDSLSEETKAKFLEGVARKLGVPVQSIRLS